jgi:molybdenum cofactor cytidylyltransferase
VIAGLILAAGTSSRLGRPKQLLPLGDRTVLQHVVDAAAAADLDDIIVVLGHRAAEVEASIRLPRRGRVVVNPEFGSGQASSLGAGLRALGEDTRAAMVLLGDQPGVTLEAIGAVAAAYRRTGGPVVQASYRGRPGHPVLLDRGVWAEVEAVSGDVGARDLLAEHPEWVVPAVVPGDPPPDLDTWQDYQRLGEEA